MWPWPWGHTKCCPVPSTSYDKCTCKDWSYYIEWFRRCTYKNVHYLTLTLITQNVAQYPPHHVTCMYLQSLAQGFMRICITRKYIIWPWPWCQGHTKCGPVPSTSCDLWTYKVWSCYVQQFRRRCIYKKIHYLTLTLRSMPHKRLHHVTYAPAKFEVATFNNLGDAFTRQYTIWSYDHMKCQPRPSTSCVQCVCRVWSCYVQRFRRGYNYKKHDGRTDIQTDNGPTMVWN